jgi:hypothetical protein
MVTVRHLQERACITSVNGTAAATILMERTTGGNLFGREVLGMKRSSSLKWFKATGSLDVKADSFPPPKLGIKTNSCTLKTVKAKQVLKSTKRSIKAPT